MKMFEDAGTKIRKWAEALFVIETVIACIGGFITMLSDDEMILIGLLTAGVGVLVAFITSLFLSAFGELVESTTENKRINAKILEKLEDMHPTHPVTYANPVAAPASREWYCTACGEKNSRNYERCSKCGKQRPSDV